MIPVERDTTASVTFTAGHRPLVEAEAAARLGLKVATLRAWRHQGKGPAFVRLGRAIRYLTADIDDFLQASRRGSSADVEK